MTGTVDPSRHALSVESLDYPLPESLIATRPAEPRDSARMMVVHRGSDAIEHARVCDLPSYLRSGDRLIFNNTAVIPARLIGHRVDSGGRVEGLYLNTVGPHRWQVMLRSNGKLRSGMRIALEDRDGKDQVELRLVERDAAVWEVEVSGDDDAERLLDEVGLTPLPPYILRSRTETMDDADDRRWYQTVYADLAHRQSVAAPTAGLHFTPGLLGGIDAVGVERLEVTLHVGAGTFKPISTATLDEHEMHREWYHVGPAVLAALREGTSRRIAIGTTTVRTLESLPSPLPKSAEGIGGMTDLLIAPPYEFRNVDGMLTNFHLPRSTLLALVGAMVGLKRLLSLYDMAIGEGYRFYSYGDAMLILP